MTIDGDSSCGLGIYLYVDSAVFGKVVVAVIVVAFLIAIAPRSTLCSKTRIDVANVAATEHIAVTVS